MKLSEIQGKENTEYGDVEIRLLIKKSQKKANAPAEGDLKKLLNKLRLDDTATYWEVKKQIWHLLNIPDPIKLPVRENKTIYERSIENSAEKTILRDKEGSILTSLLSLPDDPEKEELDEAFFRRIIELTSDNNVNPETFTA